MAAGQGFKTFTTGEVLTAGDVNGYLMQGVLVFASAAARDAAITSPQEGQCCYLKDTDAVLTYSGVAWVGFDDSNAIQNTIVDAKGDIVAASGSDTPARLAVGNNGETLVADSSTSTGLRYTAGTVQANPVLNSALQNWQRGTSIAYAGGNQYTADRWCFGSGATGRTISRQVTNDTTNLPNIQYCARVQRDSGNSSTAALKLNQSFESINSIPFAGKAVVVSFYARAGANFSAASSLMTGILYSGTGTDQNVDVTYTGQATVATASATLTTTWQRFTATGTVASTATEIALLFSYTPVGTASTNDYFEITGVQIDIGSVALPFRTYAGTIQGELAACQRYYWRSANNGTDGYCNLSTTRGAKSTTVAEVPFTVPVQMRIVPTTFDYSTINLNDGANAVAIGTPLIVNAIATQVNVQFTTTGLTQYRPYGIIANASSAAYVAFSAEL